MKKYAQRAAPSVWIGFDPREAAAFAVARHSIWKNCSHPRPPVFGLVLDRLRKAGLYWRPTEMRPGSDRDVMWDVISDAPMSTEFAVSRFLVPSLARSGWALFMDCDMLIRADLDPLFRSLDTSKAVYCVKHNYRPPEGVKMDGMPQTAYSRKNWTSFCIFNADHPANSALNLDLVNSVPGRDLHALCWLEDDLIGELPPEWNFLIGHSDPSIDPKNVHFTEGGPWFEAYKNVPFAEEWTEALYDWAER